MAQLKVLITTSYFWPEDAGSAPYLTGLADHLAERGHDVLVATTFAHYPEWASSANGRLAANERRNGVTIRRRWTYVPGTQSALHRAGYELSLLSFGLTALPWRWRPDVVLGTCPSLAGGTLAGAASKLYRVPYGIVFQDLMGLAASQSGVAGGARVAGFVRSSELRLAAGAARIGIIAEGFRRYFVGAGLPSEKIDRLRNWTRRVAPDEERSDTRRRYAWEDDFVCVHGGNMGQKQGLDNLLDAAALLRGTGVRIALVGDGNDRPRLERIAAEKNLDNVDFIDMQGPGRWEATMQAADLLLVNQRASVMDMSLPSKLTSYFASGQPVVAAVSADSETAHEITSARAGIVVPPAEPAALRDAIVLLKEDRARGAELGTGGEAYARSKLSRENALAEYDVFVEKLLGGARRPPFSSRGLLGRRRAASARRSRRGSPGG
jgi:glycosyltransferase involved in cell wall biosynthesis